MAEGAYARALEEARAEFAAAAPGVVTAAAGVGFEPDEAGGTFVVPYLDTTLHVQHPAGTVRDAGDPAHGEVTVALTIVVLHYLSRSVGPTDLADPVRFQGLPGAGAYAAAFHQHAEVPVAGRFGEDGPGYLRAAAALGGRPAGGADGVADPADAEVTWVVPFLPHLPLGLRLGLAEDPMPAECVVLFPKRAGFVYHVEDLAIAGELLSDRLLQAAERQAALAVPSTSTEDAGEGVVVLTTVYDPLEAEIIVAKLRSAGIDAVVRHDALSVVYGLTVDGHGRSEVLVRAADLEEARAALPGPA